MTQEKYLHQRGWYPVDYNKENWVNENLLGVFSLSYAVRLEIYARNLTKWQPFSHSGIS